MDTNTKQILRHLHGLKTMQGIAKEANLLSAINSLQIWQNKQFLLRYQALYKNQNSKAAITFLVKQLFTLQYFDLNQDNIQQHITRACKMLPEKARQTLATALQFNAICFELDFELAKRLTGTDNEQGLIIDQQSYIQAYIDSNNLTLRQQQIECIRNLGTQMVELCNMLGLPCLLYLYRKPAKICGLQDLHEFLESSVLSFNRLSNAESFIHSLVNDELAMSRNLLSQDPSPLNGQ